jgi:hypothetical protein
MKVTRKYIRKLVLEAMNEMENFDFNFTLEQVLQVAQDKGVKAQKRGFTITTNGFPVFYVLKVNYDTENKSMSYRLSRVESENMDNPQRKVDVIAEVDVKSHEIAEGLISLIYAVRDNNTMYLDDLYNTIVLGNERR